MVGLRKKKNKYKYKCKLWILWLEHQLGHFNAIYRESVYIVLRRCLYFIFGQCIKLSECNNNSQLSLPLHRLLTNHCKHLYRAKQKTLMNRKKLEREPCPLQGRRKRREGSLKRTLHLFYTNVKPKSTRMVK